MNENKINKIKLFATGDSLKELTSSVFNELNQFNVTNLDNIINGELYNINYELDLTWFGSTNGYWCDLELQVLSSALRDCDVTILLSSLVGGGTISLIRAFPNATFIIPEKHYRGVCFFSESFVNTESEHLPGIGQITFKYAEVNSKRNIKIFSEMSGLSEERVMQLASTSKPDVNEYVSCLDNIVKYIENINKKNAEVMTIFNGNRYILGSTAVTGHNYSKSDDYILVKSADYAENRLPIGENTTVTIYYSSGGGVVDMQLFEMSGLKRLASMFKHVEIIVGTAFSLGATIVSNIIKLALDNVSVYNLPDSSYLLHSSFANNNRTQLKYNPFSDMKNDMNTEVAAMCFSAFDEVISDVDVNTLKNLHDVILSAKRLKNVVPILEWCGIEPTLDI